LNLTQESAFQKFLQQKSYIAGKKAYVDGMAKVDIYDKKAIKN
jgi:hypothetical protein